jgi:hypothetical protein
MEIVKLKLGLITDFWNSYVLNFHIIQNEIRWNSEVQNNYFGDILNYLTDTFELIERKPLETNFKESIFYATGLLQIIYIHQDLTDELLYLFKLVKSSKTDKNPNREIRNELIGHPVSRENMDNSRKLKSTVFWGKNLAIENLHYIVYSADLKFKGIDKSFKTQNIIDTHIAYLDKYFEQILQQIRTILKRYSKHLAKLQNALDNKVAFYNIIELTSQLFESILKQNYIYDVTYLKECYKRKNEHIRYNYAIDSFLKELDEYLVDTQYNIQILLSKIENKYDSKEAIKLPELNFVIIRSSQEPIAMDIPNRTFDYELSKLHGKTHPIYNVSFFKNQFIDYPEIIEELENMELNLENNLEYYTSFEYLTNLIAKRMN